MVNEDFKLMLQGYGLTTAEIVYRMPDHRHVLQTFVWQEYDLAPKYPKLMAFLDFWKREIEGPLHSVVYTHRHLIGPSEWRSLSGVFRLN